MSSAAPAPAPFPAPAPAPYPAPAPAPFPQPGYRPMAKAPFPAPAPAPMPLSQNVSSSEEEESETESSYPAPMPAPVPVVNSQPPQSTTMDFTNEIEQQEQNEESGGEPSPENINGDNQQSSAGLKAAAELIHTLDSAYAQANAENATTALDADEARTAARTAAEIVRRYTTRSHPREGSDLTNTFERDSPASVYRTGRAPMTIVNSNNHKTFFAPTPAENNGVSYNLAGSSSTPTTTAAEDRVGITNTTNGGNSSYSDNNTDRLAHSIYIPKTSPTNRIVTSRADDALHLSLEVERTKQALEAERMAHDETKNYLAEERARTSHLQQKLERVQNTMETQRETLGRSEDALEEELQRAKLRMEAAEEDAQLALDFAKESEESREQLEGMLQEAMAEIEALREQQTTIIQNYAAHAVAGEEVPPAATTADQQDYQYHQEATSYQSHYSGQEGVPTQAAQQEYPQEQQAEYQQDEQQQEYQQDEAAPFQNSNRKPMEEEETELETPKRSVHFSDPISFSNSPNEDSVVGDEIVEEEEFEEEQLDDNEPQVQTPNKNLSTPSRPSRPLVSAGRKLLQQSLSKDNLDDENNNSNQDKTYSFAYTPEKSAERRQRLRDQLKQMDSAVVIPTPERSPHRKQLQFSTNVLDLVKTSAEIMHSSGHRLELDGHWWREKKADGSEEVPLDSLARQYCQSVEVKISRQKNEISELESLCSFLEESVASNAGAAKTSDGYNESSDEKWDGA